jgi:hypothetical protein
MVLAAAGRRIDADGTSPPRFPLSNVARVARDVDALLRELRPAAVVCSAACGADLIVADRAVSLGIRTRIVLPFQVERFRTTSVADRPGVWDSSFDRLVDRAAASDDLLVLSNPENDQGYKAANREILAQAQGLAIQTGDSHVVAMVVWDGKSRGEDDLTEDFLNEAHGRGWPTPEILTA